MTQIIPYARYDSRDIPLDQRIGAFQQIFSATAILAVSDPSSFIAQADGWAIGRLLFGHAFTPALTATRTPEKAEADLAEHHIFMSMRSGEVRGEFDGRAVYCPPGSTFAMDMARSFKAEHTTAECFTLSVPRLLLEAATHQARSFHGLILAGSIGRLFADHLRSVVEIASQLKAQEAGVIERTTLQLLAACLPASGARQTALPAFAVRNDVQRYIEQNLHRSDLDPASICTALGLSRAGAYRAFADTGGIAKYIQTRRLNAARAMLLHPNEHRPIGDVAFAVGYTDPAMFSRAYRRAHDETPRETREAASYNPLPAMDEAHTGRENFARWLGDLASWLSQMEQV